METITILRPYFRLPNHSLFTQNKLLPFTPNQNFRPRSSSSTTCTSFSLSISCTSISKRNPVRKTRFLMNPFRFLVPFLHNFKNFFISGWEKFNCGGELSIEEEERPYGVLECGGIGTALLSTTLRLSPVLTTLSMNPTFVSGLFAWATAQFLKFFLNFFVERKWDFRVLVDCGGMPSSHAALCTSLTTSVALCHGISDSLFPVCLGFTLIVMYDATGVRRHAGMQAEVLNVIVEDMFKGHPVSERKLKELLGHTPSQVFAGAFVGIFVAYLCCQRWLLGA